MHARNMGGEDLHTSKQVKHRDHSMKLLQYMDIGSFERSSLGLGSFHGYSIIPMQMDHQ